MAIHALGDIAGQEVELLAFDCFRVYPVALDERLVSSKLRKVQARVHAVLQA